MKPLDSKQLAGLAKQGGIALPKPPAKPKKIDAAAEAKLIDAIARAPGDAKARHAYATFLAEHGDPLGMLALVGQARSELVRQERELLHKHAAVLLGPLAAWIDKNWITAAWKDGYLDDIDVDIRDRIGITGTEVMKTILEHPSGNRLRVLRISGNATPGGYRDAPQELIDAVVDVAPASLRELAVAGTFGSPCGDVSAVWEALPKLTEFWAFGAEIKLGTFKAPALKNLRIQLMTVSDEVFDAIENASLPKLEQLALPGATPRMRKALAKKFRKVRITFA